MSNPRFKRVVIFSIILISAVLYRFYFTPHHIVIQGQTMGTTYTIKATFPHRVLKSTIDNKIAHQLELFSLNLSTYDKNSTISKFNKSESGLEINEQFNDVFLKSKLIYKQTFGTWDPTITPLLSLWGFLSPNRSSTIPTRVKILLAKNEMGFNLIRYDNGFLRKLSPHLTLDFSSIAKGYGVDIIGEWLNDNSASDFLIEIGGEMLAKGNSPSGQPWKVGINIPDSASSITDLFTVVSLKNKALATSGDYRQYFEVEGKRYSHILDPRSGFPISHNLVSVSVIAPDCMSADAYATALMVIGFKAGIELVESISDIDALFITKTKKGQLKSFRSSNFKSFELSLN